MISFNLATKCLYPPRTSNVSPASTLPELGLTQYCFGAVVLTLKAIGEELGLWMVIDRLTSWVRGPGGRRGAHRAEDSDREGVGARIKFIGQRGTTNPKEEPTGKSQLLRGIYLNRHGAVLAPGCRQSFRLSKSPLGTA